MGPFVIDLSQELRSTLRTNRPIVKDKIGAEPPGMRLGVGV